MAIHKGPWEPVDTTKGVWLNADRDEFGHYTYTMGVEGELYQITETAYEHLSKVWVDSRNQGAKQEREGIIKLLKSKLCFCLNMASDVTFADKQEQLAHMNCDWKAMMIEYHVELIREGQSE